MYISTAKLVGDELTNFKTQITTSWASRVYEIFEDLNEVICKGLCVLSTGDCFFYIFTGGHCYLGGRQDLTQTLVAKTGQEATINLKEDLENGN
jgi:hypothetical protein